MLNIGIETPKGRLVQVIVSITPGEPYYKIIPAIANEVEDGILFEALKSWDYSPNGQTFKINQAQLDAYLKDNVICYDHFTALRVFSAYEVNNVVVETPQFK